NRRSVTQAELVQILGFSKAKLSKLLSQMEKEGLIRREKFKKTFIITIAEKRSTSASER
ncbi:MAG TPA: MarR family transcriptional regulator, partial [Candidatus Korarchaeota archaeon]|nr:MarR family transcriptional regulator [Candidatus Korarchaeota archaeon]